jgi:hypothetical protein
VLELKQLVHRARRYAYGVGTERTEKSKGENTC